jgi:hypothetical protein
LEAGVDFVTNEAGNGPSRIEHHVDPMGDLHTFLYGEFDPGGFMTSRRFISSAHLRVQKRHFIEVV